MVWATGYRFDHSWIDVPGVLRDGRVVHTRGITEVPGLYFLGLPWQSTRGSALLGFVTDDAAHIAARVRLARPPRRTAGRCPGRGMRPTHRLPRPPSGTHTFEHRKGDNMSGNERSSHSRSTPG